MNDSNFNLTGSVFLIYMKILLTAMLKKASLVHYVN